jgi:hypothetical protein
VIGQNGQKLRTWPGGPLECGDDPFEGSAAGGGEGGAPKSGPTVQARPYAAACGRS